jgi:hypothetical protein
MDNFMKAGVEGQDEPKRGSRVGVSASIIYGNRAVTGTGLCDLTLDLHKLAIRNPSLASLEEESLSTAME